MQQEPKGRYVPLSGPRLFINDLVHFAKKVPSVPVSRTIDISALIEPRRAHRAKPSWACLFMKAYGIVCAKHAPLRRAHLDFPWPKLYEHPRVNCAITVERIYQGEEGVFVGLFRAPDQQSLDELQTSLLWYKNEEIEKIGFYRQALRSAKVPRPIRRFFWWAILNISGYKRSKRFGTFGLSSYGSLGAESLHPISPLTTALTYGPIDPAGRVIVKLIYDHRVLDGSYVAHRLREIEETLNGPILDELREGRGSRDGSSVPKPHVIAACRDISDRSIPSS